MLNSADDRDLAAAARSGDRVAFGRLLERHYALIYRLAYRYVGAAADAEDIAQDVCLALATRIGQFSGRSLFTTWLCAIVINACRDFFRRRKAAEGLVARYAAQRALDEGDAEDSARRTAWVEEALAKLEPSLRETALLVIGEDMAHAEAAEALGCAEGTVAWRMNQVRKRLKTILDDVDG
jgi:RNA polymerase sigma-70 factor (ECF subfamily)